jgi:hypothetical protein
MSSLEEKIDSSIYNFLVFTKAFNGAETEYSTYYEYLNFEKIVDSTQQLRYLEILFGIGHTNVLTIVLMTSKKFQHKTHSENLHPVGVTEWMNRLLQENKINIFEFMLNTYPEFEPDYWMMTEHIVQHKGEYLPYLIQKFPKFLDIKCTNSMVDYENLQRDDDYFVYNKIYDYCYGLENGRVRNLIFQMIEAKYPDIEATGSAMDQAILHQRKDAIRALFEFHVIPTPKSRYYPMYSYYLSLYSSKFVVHVDHQMNETTMKRLKV